MTDEATIWTVSIDDDEVGEVEADTAEEALRGAEELCRDNASPGEKTQWYRVAVSLGTITDTSCCSGEHARSTVAIDPEEPDCSEGDHKWRRPLPIVGGVRENPGVTGNGGGVIVKEVCRKCGTLRVTDTWAQDPETGEQGLTAVSYVVDYLD